MELATQNWLTARAQNDLLIKSAIRTLSLSLRDEQDDEWLLHFLAAPRSDSAITHLQAAIELNHTGRAESAEHNADLAKAQFGAVGNLPGQLRAELELVYALRRQSKTSSCDDEIVKARNLLQHYHFVWLDLQLGIEQSVCAGMAHNFGLAAQIAGQEFQKAQSARYPALELRSQGLIASWHTLEGRTEASWIANQEGLRLFWRGTFPSERGFQFYSDAATSAEQSQRWFLAELLESEALAMLSETKRIDFQALAHSRRATDFIHVNAFGQSRRELSLASTLFDRLGDRKASELYRGFSDIELARLDIAGERLDAGAKLLERMSTRLQEAENIAVNLPLEETWAALFRAKSDIQNEKQHLSLAMRIASLASNSLPTEEQRLNWRREVDLVYRRHLEIEINEKLPADKTLEDWRAYQDLGQHKPMPLKNRFDSAAAQFHPGNKLTIVFAVLSDRFVIWTVHGKKVQLHTVKTDTRKLLWALHRFYLLCSDPGSPLEKVNRDSLRLYKLMITPIATEIAGIADIYIDADDAIGPVPWSALMSRPGTYFGDEHHLTLSVETGRRNAGVKAQTSEIHPLFVVPSGGRVADSTFPFLPNAEDEVEGIARLYANSKVFAGPSATRDRIMRALPLASFFHFAGHAVNRNGGGELVLFTGTKPDFITASSISRLSLDNLTLVFLAACSTADVSGGNAATNPYGLVRAFLSSGSNNVIASEWIVDSNRTSSFVRAFYAELYSSGDPSASLDFAARTVRRSQKGMHPYYWAAFQLFSTRN